MYGTGSGVRRRLLGCVHKIRHQRELPEHLNTTFNSDYAFAECCATLLLKTDITPSIWIILLNEKVNQRAVPVFKHSCKKSGKSQEPVFALKRKNALVRRKIHKQTWPQSGCRAVPLPLESDVIAESPTATARISITMLNRATQAPRK
jgi:hypothetical protein